jgi:hypothetical protein
MKEATRTIQTTGLRNLRSPWFLFCRPEMLLCFCAIGIYSSSLLVGFGRLPNQESKPTPHEQSPEIIQFKLDMEGSGYGKDRMRMSFARYKAGDGVTVERRIETYPSPSAAQEEMTSMVRSADKIVARTPERDPQGKVTGERFTLAYAHTESNKPRYLVLWKDKKSIYILESASLRHLLAFEGQIEARAGSTTGEPK